jgi:putative aldouronate transport system permease protein
MLIMKRNKIKYSAAYNIFTVFNTLIMLCLVAATLYPLVYVLFASLSTPDLLLAKKGGLLLRPAGMSMASYKMVFKDPMIIKGYSNTLYVVVVGVILNMFATIISAYFLSRSNAKLVKPVMMMILFTMYFSGGIVPFYFIVKAFNLHNSLLSLIIPCAINTYYLIIMRTAFVSVPKSIEESARIDGANHMILLFRILVPLILPTIAVIALYYTVEKWNAWFYASIFLNDRKKYPLQLVLREILIQNDTAKMTTGTESADMAGIAETIKYAVMIVSTLPILLVYPLLQRFFVKGVMIGAIKG